jgi:urea transporter
MSVAQTATPRAATQWARGLFNGQGQVFFQQNILTGALIIAAFVVADWRMAILAVLGTIGGMAGGRAMRFSLHNVGTGMQSFCGTLVGAAVFAALGGSSWWPYVLAFVGGIATGPVTWLVNALFTKTGLARFELPYTTAPFVIVATIIVVATRPLAQVAAASALPTEPAPAFFVSLLTNVSQVVLVDNVFSGALILLGLFIANWKVGTAAVLGSVVGSAVAIVLGESWSEIANGLAGYSGVLTAIALAVTFVKSSIASWLYMVPWVAVTAVVTLLMHRAGVETYTWPYILTTWAALIVAYSLKVLTRS